MLNGSSEWSSDRILLGLNFFVAKLVLNVNILQKNFAHRLWEFIKANRNGIYTSFVIRNKGPLIQWVWLSKSWNPGTLKQNKNNKKFLLYCFDVISFSD